MGPAESRRCNLVKRGRWLSLMQRMEKGEETFSRRFLHSRELPPDCISKNKSSSNGSTSTAYMDGATKRRRMMQFKQQLQNATLKITLSFFLFGLTCCSERVVASSRNNGHDGNRYSVAMRGCTCSRNSTEGSHSPTAKAETPSSKSPG